jgi:hypothetical protein
VLNSLELYDRSNVEFPANEKDEFPSNDGDAGAANSDNDDEDGDGGGSIRFLFATDRGGVDSDSAGHSTQEETEEDAG